MTYKSEDDFKLTKEQIEEAGVLRKKILSGFKNGKPLLKAIKDHEEIAEKKIKQWKEDTDTSAGLSIQNINKYKSKLLYMSRLDAGCKFSDAINEKPTFCSDSIHSFEKCLERARTIIKAAEAYLESDISEEAKNEYLKDTQWAVFFSYYPNERTSKINEGLIGKAILSVNGLNNEDESVTFENTELDDVKTFTGKYISHMDIHGGYVLFDLDAAKNNPEIGRHIHIKAYCHNRDQELLIGHYTTYEKSHIQSGRVLFINLETYKKLKDGADSGVFSQRINSAKFNNDYIPKAVIKFLSVRTDNYKNDVFKGLDHKIQTVDALYKELHGKRQLDNSRFEKFIERIKPKLFLASAGTNKIFLDIFPEMEKQLDKHFKEKLYISYKVGKLGDEDRFEKIDEDGFLQPFRDIEKLKRTRFFILFIDDVEKLSYSFLQLGIALTVSKVVVVVGRKNSLSNTILNMREQVIQKVIVDDIKPDFDFSKDYEVVIERLIAIIKKNLELFPAFDDVKK